jgi:hypothetical protein
VLLPVSLLQGSSSYGTIVMSTRHQELSEKLAPYTEGRKLGADGYGLACMLSFYNPGFYSHFARGTHHGRQDDVITDWREWIDRDVMILHTKQPQLEKYEGLFDAMRIEAVEVEGHTFYLLLGDRLRWEEFRQRILVPIRNRYYQIPRWLPMDQCFFRGRYFPEESGASNVQP